MSKILSKHCNEKITCHEQTLTELQKVDSNCLNSWLLAFARSSENVWLDILMKLVISLSSCGVSGATEVDIRTGIVGVGMIVETVASDCVADVII